MAFSPVIASKNIVEKYKRYLNTMFDISDKIYAGQFNSELAKEDVLAKGPYLDVTDSFVKGKSMDELIEMGSLSPGFEKIKMPLNRPLYKHQEEAIIRKALKGKNMVVSTGTGSGKTECFLIPILNHLMREYENDNLEPGIRALLIYPMNALANDQIERLRSLLSEFPEITYGSYTGQTKKNFKDAVAEYVKLNNGKYPQENELISREQMKETPPHILITNYAMLEYLMIRPDDSIFFDKIYSDKWKYIVLDEAHVYNGSTGIEVSMLLRRLKAKLGNKNIQYILTSATLGSDDDNELVAEFASNLCASKFDANDVIRAKRIKLEVEGEIIKLPQKFYNEIVNMSNSNKSDMEIKSKVAEYVDIDKNDNLGSILYTIILQDSNYWSLRRLLTKPKTIFEIAEKMGWSTGVLENFISVASMAEKNGDRLFDARYHMFLRATESVFITLKPSKKLFLTRKKVHYEGDLDYKVFEIATCSHCHDIYLIGEIVNNYLEQSSYASEDNLRAIFLLGDSISDTDEDNSLEDEKIKADKFEICSRCGYLVRPGTEEKNRCEHGSNYYINVYRVKIENESKILTKCLSCENVNSFGILRMFFSGQEAVTSVISTALFEELPSYELKEEIVVKDDDTGFGFSNDDINGVRINKVNIAKQFIAFSDSRQAAAFFSSYLDQTYKNILYKRVIVETLKDMHYSSRGKMFNNFVEDIAYQFEEHGIYFRNQDVINKESWKAALRELVDNTGSTSLFSKGLIGISLNSKNIPKNSKLGLTSKQVQNICSIFALWMMADAALDYPANLNKADREYFSHNGIEYSYTLSDSNAKKYIRSFIPTKANMTNKRLDYFLKVMKKLGYNMDRIKGSRYLQGIWNNIFISNNFEFLTVKDGKYKLNTDNIIISNNNQWYYCPVCKKVTIHNVMNICPTFKCGGGLKAIDLKDKFSKDHYYQLYKTLDIKELRVVEHTAQLDKETAYEYQKKFKNKEIDILSCSTTFEMGVDVGSLETIFMRNMPPSPANYAQRAGRAGRSKKSAAYAITFCNKSNHDFTFFKNPERMIRGRIDPPRFVVENEKIAIRHLYASALSYFWKRYPSYFSRTFNMTESIDGQTSGFEVFKDYLNEHPVDLKRFIDQFLPENLNGKFGIENYSWIDGLMGDEGVFTKAVAEYDYEVGELQDAFNRALEKGRKTDNLNARIRVYKNEDILAFLSRKNVLPKYGFPVDTVEMIINDKSGNSKLGLQLQRDLSMAISEYAPDSQIVANGNLITSRYIRKIPNMSWKQFDYKICDCKTLNIAVHTTDDEDSLDLDKCKQCGASLSVKSKQVFLVPEFGFEADGDKIKKPGLKKPERTYRGEASYVGYRSQVQMQKYRIGNSEFELRLSRGDEMAVLNESNFYVCEYCGYAELHNKVFTRIKRQKHKNPSGYTCRNDGTNRLRKFSLGYRFETDVVQLRFINPDLSDYNISLSVLHGIVLGTCGYLNIEQSDIAGCLQYFYNTVTNRANYSIILYDRTPGGAGHVRRLNNEKVLENILMETLRLMEACHCGGKLGNSSCYSCLRTYYNQRIHDILERRYVINFIKQIFM